MSDSIFGGGDFNTNGIAGIAKGFAAGLQRQQLDEHISDLKSREELAKKFDEIEKDSTYDKQERDKARDYAMELRLLEPKAQRPPHFKPDKSLQKNGAKGISAIPAWFEVTHRRALKSGPAEPKQPQEPADPTAMDKGPPDFESLIAMGHSGEPDSGHMNSINPQSGGGAGPQALPDFESIMAAGHSGAGGPVPLGGGATGAPSNAVPLGGNVHGAPPGPPALSFDAGYESSRLSPAEVKIADAKTQTQIDELKRDALIASLKKHGVSDDIITRVITDQVPGVTLQNPRQFAPQKVAIKTSDGQIHEVRAVYTGAGYVDAMTQKPIVGEIVGSPRWLDLGDKLSMVDSVSGKPLGPTADKKIFKIDPISGDIVSVTGESGVNYQTATPTAAPPPPPSVDQTQQIPPTPAPRHQTRPHTATHAAIGSVDDLFPNNDPISINARAVANNNGKIENLQGNALKTGVQKALHDAGVLLIPEKEREGLSDAIRVRQLTNDLRTYVQKIQSDPTDLSTINMLNSTVESIRGIYAKGTFREAGVLTDRDIERSGALLPGGFSSAIEGATGIMQEQPLKKLDELDRILRRGLATKFRGRSGKWLQGFGSRADVLPTASDETIHRYLDGANGDTAKARAAMTEDGWEIPK